MQDATGATPRYESQVDAVLEHLPIAAGRFNRRGKLCFANSEWVRRLDMPSDQIQGQPLSGILRPEAQQRMLNGLGKALAGESVKYVADYVYPKLGERQIEVSMVPDRTPDGEIAGALFFISDITERHDLKSAQKDIADYITALNAHAIVAVTDVRGVITWANDKFCSISKYSREELYGRTHSIINSGHHPRSYFAKLWKTLVSGQIWQGEICNRAKDGTLYWVYSTIVPFLDADGKPEKYIAIRADITKLKQVEQEAQYLSRYDFLTGLPNRRVLMERLDEARDSSVGNRQYCALLSIDLDEFKKVNDYFGHIQGDRLLVMTAQRLSGCLRQTDTVARMGGDEFQVILTHLGEDIRVAAQRARVIGDKILSEMTKAYQLSGGAVQQDGGGVFITGSIGAELFCGDAISSEELLKQVDLALYRAKSNGRNQLVFFDASLQEEANTLIAMEHDLRGALERGELFLVYQPIVDQDGNTLGMEALLRWRHGGTDLISPGSFIPLAEQTGLIVPIGNWVLEEACRQLVAWSRDPRSEAWSLSVNVSARQFNEPLFVEHVLNMLARTGANPHRLTLELTETALLAVADRHLLEKIDQLKRDGVSIALDDFGTGYSSLSYLRRLPLDRVKIDQSFVKDLIDNPKDQGVIQAILSLAHALRLHVVAEGVETVEQFEYLRDAGCPGFQGYLFGRPAEMALQPV